MSGSPLKYSILIFVVVNACTGRAGFREPNKANVISNGVRYAERFEIQHKKGYSILTVKNPWQGAKNVSETYFLVQNGKDVPAGIDSLKVIRVPINKIICMSTTHLAMISVLHEEKTIKGVSGTDFLYEKKLGELIESQKIADVGYEDNLNKEIVIQIAPDLVMVYGIGSESAGYMSKLKELGIKIIFNADYLETNPLGKAEWIRVFGALYDKENEADSIFSVVSEKYNSLKSFINANIKDKPSVFLGLPWKDTWFISPGNSYICNLISDAGGDYLWKDVKSEISMPFGIENVYVRAIHADYWLNISSANSREEIISVDNRLGELPSFKKGNTFNNNNRVTSKGGNDYWESGSINPQIILKDIASILHPGLFPGYEFYYYKKIE
jgi:iron complex transport system substrate-binding protein